MKRILLLPFHETSAFIVWFIFSLPGKTGSALRYLFARSTMGECGPGVRLVRMLRLIVHEILTSKKRYFWPRVWIECLWWYLIIGSNCKFNRNVSLNASVASQISFGKECIIGPGVILRSSNHRSTDLNTHMMYQGHESGSITIGDNVWIGAGAIILPNVKIGDGVIIGAGSVVTKSFTTNQVIGGVPAKLIKERSWWFAQSVTLLIWNQSNPMLQKIHFSLTQKFASVVNAACKWSHPYHLKMHGRPTTNLIS